MIEELLWHAVDDKKTAYLTWRNICVCRASLARGIDTTIYGSFVNVLETEDFLSARIFVSSTLSRSFHIPSKIWNINSSICYVASNVANQGIGNEDCLWIANLECCRLIKLLLRHLYKVGGWPPTCDLILHWHMDQMPICISSTMGACLSMYAVLMFGKCNLPIWSLFDRG